MDVLAALPMRRKREVVVVDASESLTRSDAHVAEAREVTKRARTRSGPQPAGAAGPAGASAAGKATSSSSSSSSSGRSKPVSFKSSLSTSTQQMSGTFDESDLSRIAREVEELGAKGLSKRARRKWDEKKREELGIQTKPVVLPRSMSLGIKKKAEYRQEKAYKRAKELGLDPRRPERAKDKAKEESRRDAERSNRANPIFAPSGRMGRDGMLRLKKSEIAGITQKGAKERRSAGGEAIHKMLAFKRR